MTVTVSNLLMGPATIYVATFGATEPANTVTAPSAAWRDLGGTDGGARMVVSQTYTPMTVDQVAMPVGSRRTEQSVSVATSMAEATLTNLALALNQPSPANEVQTLNLGAATAGTFTLTFSGQTTSAIAFNATASAVQTALEALSSIGVGNVTVTGGPLPAAVTITFTGTLAGIDVAALTGTPTGLTGGTLTLATTTPGGSSILEIDADISNSEPLYRAVLLRGQKPGGGGRDVFIRRALSTESVEMAWTKDGKTMIPVTFSGYYVSSSIKALKINDSAT